MGLTKRQRAARKGVATKRARRAALVELQELLNGWPKGWRPPELDKAWTRKLDRAVEKMPSKKIDGRVRDVIRRKARNAYANRNAWRDWEELALERMNGEGAVDASEAQQAGLSPWDPGRAFGWALLIPYVNAWDAAAWNAWRRRYGFTVFKSWADTGILPEDAADAPCEWREETRVMSAPKILGALFQDVGVGTWALRADASVLEAKCASCRLVLEAGQWVRERRIRRRAPPKTNY